MNTSSEHRQFPRVDTQLRVFERGRSTAASDEVLNISEAGALIRTRRPMAVGTHSVFALVIPSEATPLEVAGTVVWTGKFAMGVRFAHVNPRLMAWIERWRKDARRV